MRPPDAVDFKLKEGTADNSPVVGRWFLRPVLDTEEDSQAERWKLSFRHPELPRKARQEGEGYEAAVDAVFSTVDELSARLLESWREQLLTFERLSALPGNRMITVPGLRARSVQAIRTRIRREWTATRKAFEAVHLELYQTLLEARWPIDQLPPWAWDPETPVSWPPKAE